MVLLAYRHGLRASEVCRLKLADMDLKSGSISIRRLKGSPHTVQPLYRHKGQPLLDETAALRAWLRERRPDGSDYLFLSQKGGCLNRSQFFRVVQACAEDAGLAMQKRHPQLPCLTSGRGQRKPRARAAMPRPQSDRKHHEVCGRDGLTGDGGSAGGSDAALLECPRRPFRQAVWPIGGGPTVWCSVMI